MWLEKAPRGSCAGQNRQRLISRLVNTSRFTEKGEGVDYPLKTRLSSSMALCACIRIHSAGHGSASGSCADIDIMTG